MEEKKEEKQEEKKEIKRLKRGEKLDTFKSRKIEKPKISFDVYFQQLLRNNKSVQRHHKAPIRKYMELKGVLEATVEEFDRLYKLY